MAHQPPGNNHQSAGAADPGGQRKAIGPWIQQVSEGKQAPAWAGQPHMHGQRRDACANGWLSAPALPPVPAVGTHRLLAGSQLSIEAGRHGTFAYVSSAPGGAGACRHAGALPPAGALAFTHTLRQPLMPAPPPAIRLLPGRWRRSFCWAPRPRRRWIFSLGASCCGPFAQARNRPSPAPSDCSAHGPPREVPACSPLLLAASVLGAPLSTPPSPCPDCARNPSLNRRRAPRARLLPPTAGA